MKHINTEKAELLAVKVPELTVKTVAYMGYLIHKVHNLQNGVTDDQLSNYHELQKYLKNHNPDKDYKEVAVKLPEGNWKVLGNPFGFTEEQWKEILPDSGGKLFDYDPKHYSYYLNYEKVDHPFDSKFVNTATESGHSLLRANKIYRENPLGEYPNEPCLDPCSCSWLSPDEKYSDYLDMCNEWEEAEVNTGNWIVLIKVKE